MTMTCTGCIYYQRDDLYSGMFRIDSCRKTGDIVYYEMPDAVVEIMARCDDYYDGARWHFPEGAIA